MTTAADVKARLTGGLRAAFLDENEARARSPYNVSVSRLGGCRKAAAYALAGAEVSEDPYEDEGRASSLGTWIHIGLLPILAKIMGGQHSQNVSLRAGGMEIPGELDLLVDDVMVDLKTAADPRLQGVRRNASPYDDHRLQVWAYAVAAVQSGIPIRWVSWLYLGRERGEEEIVVEPFTDKAAVAVVNRVLELQRWALNPDKAPRDGRGPGLAKACDGCAWLRRCWGPTARPGRVGAQTAAADTPDTIRQLLLALIDAKARRLDADKEYQFLKAATAGVRPDQYGEVVIRRGKPGSAIDYAEIKRLLATLGIHDLPTHATPGSPLVRLASAMSKPMWKQLEQQRAAAVAADLTGYDTAPSEDDGPLNDD